MVIVTSSPESSSCTVASLVCGAGSRATDLQHRGFIAIAAELLSTSVGPLGDLHNDAAAVRDVLDQLTAPVVLCGHSYGGAVITETAAEPTPRCAIWPTLRCGARRWSVHGRAGPRSPTPGHGPRKVSRRSPQDPTGRSC
ncbi:MAG: alpha/beta hydrolase [Actinomycetota bacterium]|nr:alpha/beta hydrolase [Actinomycetota bacterium]